jgi:photosystem II stability/assembly factor-like uncharacterized protein
VLVLVLVAVGLVAGFVVQRWASARPNFSRSIDLYGVAFPDATHGWVVGARLEKSGEGFVMGLIFATTDGGATWRQQVSCHALDPNAVAFADAKHGWVVGAPAAKGDTVILATSDGGAAWKRQDSGTRYRLWGIACANARDAWAVGDSQSQSHGVILATKDGGAHWKTQLVTDDACLSGVAFADARRGWVVGNGSIYVTVDGGATWRQQYSGAKHGLLNTDPEAVACADARHAWAVGEDDRGGLILATTDGGAHWRRQHVADYGESVCLSGVAFQDARCGWAVGSDYELGGVIIHTTDGGRSWSAQKMAVGLNGLAVPDASHGYVIGTHDKMAENATAFVGSSILRTANGGTTWKR